MLYRLHRLVELATIFVETTELLVKDNFNKFGYVPQRPVRLRAFTKRFAVAMLN